MSSLIPDSPFIYFDITYFSCNSPSANNEIRFTLKAPQTTFEKIFNEETIIFIEIKAEKLTSNHTDMENLVIEGFIPRVENVNKAFFPFALHEGLLFRRA
jgi:hypothetical protein